MSFRGVDGPSRRIITAEPGRAITVNRRSLSQVQSDASIFSISMARLLSDISDKKTMPAFAEHGEPPLESRRFYMGLPTPGFPVLSPFLIILSPKNKKATSQGASPHSYS